MVRDFLNRVFNGSAEPLLVHPIEDRRLTADEIEEIRQQQAEGRQRLQIRQPDTRHAQSESPGRHASRGDRDRGLGTARPPVKRRCVGQTIAFRGLAALGKRWQTT